VTVNGSSTVDPDGSGSIPNQPSVSPGPDGNVYFNVTAGSFNYAGMSCF
jgi:hypothetical protein